MQFISLIPFQVPIYNLFIVQKEWRSRLNPETTRTKIVCQIFFNLIVLSTDAYSDNLNTLFPFFFFQNHFQDGILTWLVLVPSALLQPSHSPLLGLWFFSSLLRFSFHACAFVEVCSFATHGKLFYPPIVGAGTQGCLISLWLCIVYVLSLSLFLQQKQGQYTVWHKYSHCSEKLHSCFVNLHSQ